MGWLSRACDPEDPPPAVMVFSDDGTGRPDVLDGQPGRWVWQDGGSGPGREVWVPDPE